ncbi:MAG: hypothetical protein QXG10_03495 [Candidatus Hadarchaeales archaeon]
MPARRYRTRGFSKRKVRTVTGVRISHVRKKPGKASCAMCGRPLGGVPTGGSGELSKMPASSKSPNRPFGGNLCPSCARRAILSAIRE